MIDKYINKVLSGNYTNQCETLIKLFKLWKKHPNYRSKIQVAISTIIDKDSLYINYTDDDNRNYLAYALMTRNFNAALRLIYRGINLKILSDDNVNALHYLIEAAENNYYGENKKLINEILKYLILGGVSIFEKSDYFYCENNQKDKNCNSPIKMIDCDDYNLSSLAKKELKDLMWKYHFMYIEKEEYKSNRKYGNSPS